MPAHKNKSIRPVVSIKCAFCALVMEGSARKTECHKHAFEP